MTYKPNRTHEEQVTHQIATLDKSLFKAKDLGALTLVTDYLRSHGLDFELKGSAAKNALKGNDRSYQDIDLKVNCDSTSESTFLSALQGIINNYGADLNNDHLSVKLTNVSGTTLYLDASAKERLELEIQNTRDKSRTKLDLSFFTKDEQVTFVPANLDIGKIGNIITLPTAVTPDQLYDLENILKQN